MATIRPRSAQSNTSSDEEYYEVIENSLSTAKRESVILTEAVVEAAPSEQVEEQQEVEEEEVIVEENTTETEVINDFEEVLTDAISSEVVTELNVETLPNQEAGKEKYFHLLEMAMKHENMETDMKRYSTGIDAFHMEVKGRLKLEQNLFRFAVFDILIALGIVVLANSVAWFFPSAVLIAKGLLIAHYMELNKKARQQLQSVLKEAFPEITNSDLTHASTVAYAANEGDAAIEIAENDRTIVMRKQDFSSFWHFGNSIGYVLGAPADAMGMKRGDEIVSINGIIVAALTHFEIRKMFKSVVAGGSSEIVLRSNPELLKEKETTWNRWTVILSLIVITVVTAMFKIM